MANVWNISHMSTNVQEESMLSLILSDFSFLLLLSSSSEASFAKHPTKQQVWESQGVGLSSNVCDTHILESVMVITTTRSPKRLIIRTCKQSNGEAGGVD